MKRPSDARANVAQDTLLAPPEAYESVRAAFEARIAGFARAVARRHRRGRVDPVGFEAALRGYYAALTLFATSPVPPLDDAAVAGALQTYLAGASRARALAA